MNKGDWNDFVTLNEERTITLSLDQRNLISDADQYIDWLESRKRFSEEQVKQLRETVDELLEVAGWLQSFYNDVMNTTPEYIDRCGDWNAVTYLMNEAQNAVDRAKAVRKER